MANPIRGYLNFVPQIGKRVMVDTTSVVIGQVFLADDVSIWPQAVLRADVNRISVGARTNIQDGCILHVNPDEIGCALTIGEDVTIGHRSVLHGCQISDRVLIGIGSIILDKAIIESDVIIGVGSIVTTGKHLQSGYLYMGSPARRVRPLTEHERFGLLQSASDYVILKNNHLVSLNQG